MKQLPTDLKSDSRESLLDETLKDELPAQGMNRRSFLKISSIAGAGFLLNFSLAENVAADSLSQESTLNAYISIDNDGSILIYSKIPEIGQGIKTAMPMIIAEELDADWRHVNVEQAATNTKLYGRQIAGGSRSISHAWDVMRRAGATARLMLVQAAANKWDVSVKECSSQDSKVFHRKTNREVSYGDLANAAAQLPVPAESEVTLKAREDYKLLGKRVTGVDNHAVVTGQPLFGIDQTLPGMLYAVYEKCPAIGGTINSVSADTNIDEIRQLAGVKHVFVLEGNGNPKELMPGVAIVATSTWAAFQAKKQLKINWNESKASKDSWSNLLTQAKALQEKALQKQSGDFTMFEKGDVEAAQESSGKVIDSLYSFHFVAHATLEPQNSTAWYQDGAVEIWAPTQSPGPAPATVAHALGLSKDKVTVHPTRSGGGFGRRLVNDPLCEAAAISRHINGPVKLQWTREDDMTHDFYRCGGFQAFKAGLDASGKIGFWDDHSITFTPDEKKPHIGGPRREMRYVEFPSQLVPNFRYSRPSLLLKTPCGLWRAPGSHTHAWVVQSFLHELSIAAGKDHLEFLLEIMGEPTWLPPKTLYGLNTGRAADVIKLAAAKAGWGKQLPEGRSLGLAFHFSHAGHFAEVAEVSVSQSKKLRVHKVTVAADIGLVINLSGAENQCQGAVIDGLSTMLGLEITMENGRIQQSNFDTYPLLRMHQAPQVEVHFIQSDNHPTGTGEPALPPLAPAVCNAIYMATGHRIRTLPIIKEGFTV